MVSELYQIWDQAYVDTYSFHMIDTHNKTECLIYKGYKLQKNGNNIQVLKPLGDYYIEISTKDYNKIFELGWKRAVVSLLLSDYKIKLEQISNRIKFEVNNKGNYKNIKNLKTNRENVMKEYHRLLKQNN